MPEPALFELRPFQRDALDALESGPGHLVCVAPTGSGKSLIYERFSKSGAARRMLLVTPLVALARQQARCLRAAGIRTWLGAGGEEAPALDSGSGAWIVSPEKLLVDRQRQRAREWAPDFLVVDE
jgi:superfamily II DNA helicase RecQ